MFQIALKNRKEKDTKFIYAYIYIYIYKCKIHTDVNDREWLNERGNGT